MGQLIHQASFSSPGGAGGSGTPLVFFGRSGSDALTVYGTFDGCTVTLETQSNYQFQDGSFITALWAPVRNAVFTSPEMREVALFTQQIIRATVTNPGAATNIFVLTGVN